MEHKLVSFVITSYNNYKYIYEAVESVLTQDYPYIQLIFSNDGSPDFDADALQSYVDEHKGRNIVDVQIYAHKTNRGTVQNVEFCRQKAEGDFLMYMAADDALDAPNVLSRYVSEFERLGPDVLVVCSKVAMCGESLDDIEAYEPSEEGIRAIRDSSPNQLFGRMSHTWTIPTTTCCYRKEVYEVVDGYDTDYFIMEDGPLFMKLTRNGYRIHWIDDFVAARHRGGGISHGNTLNLSEAYRKYRYDEIIFYEKEVLPFQEKLSPADKKQMESKWEYLQRAYFETFVLPNMHGLELIKYNLSHFPEFVKTLLRRTKEKAVGWIEWRDLNQNCIWIAIICAIIYLFLLFVPTPLSGGMRAWALQVSFMLSLGFCGFAVFLRVMRIIRHLYITLRYIFTGRG